MSAADANLGAPVPWARAHAEVDTHLRASGLAWTLLKPTAFLQNFLDLAPLIARSRLPHITRRGRAAYVDTRDVAAAAARLLLDSTDDNQRAGATYVLTGPEALSMPDVARGFTAALGRRVVATNVPVPMFRAALRLRGVDHWLARGLIPHSPTCSLAGTPWTSPGRSRA